MLGNGRLDHEILVILMSVYPQLQMNNNHADDHTILVKILTQQNLIWYLTKYFSIVRSIF